VTESLREKIFAEHKARADKEIAEAESKLELAGAWDTYGTGLLAPRFLMAGYSSKYDRGHLSFEGAADDAAAILARFPPVPMGYFKDGSTSAVYPLDYPMSDRYTLHVEGDGPTLNLDGGHGYGLNVKLTWYADVGDRRVHFQFELKGAHLPRIHPGRTVTVGDTFLRYEGTDTVHWDPQTGSPADFVRYGRGSPTALQHFVFYVGVSEWLDSLVELLNNEQRETRAAYAAALVSVGSTPPRAATAAECDALRAVYGREHLRAGTLLQYATLRTPTAEAWQGIASAHWPRFAEAQGIETRQSYFDHYAWACWYLDGAGVLKDDGYKYGSAWL
jgi:hypothetical protein